MHWSSWRQSCHRKTIQPESGETQLAWKDGGTEREYLFSKPRETVSSVVTTWMGDRYVPCFQRSLAPRFLRSQDLCTYTHVKDHTGSPYQSWMDYGNTKITQHALKRVKASESAREQGIALHKKAISNNNVNNLTPLTKKELLQSNA